MRVATCSSRQCRYLFRSAVTAMTETIVAKQADFLYPCCSRADDASVLVQRSFGSQRMDQAVADYAGDDSTLRYLYRLVEPAHPHFYRVRLLSVYFLTVYWQYLHRPIPQGISVRQHERLITVGPISISGCAYVSACTISTLPWFIVYLTAILAAQSTPAGEVRL